MTLSISPGTFARLITPTVLPTSVEMLAVVIVSPPSFFTRKRLPWVTVPSILYFSPLPNILTAAFTGTIAKSALSSSPVT